jgi:hypothetical protein
MFEPAVSGIAASSGATAGGETVVITGDHLTDSTNVMFGAVPAPSFSIDSNTRITATTPPEGAGAVDVTVAGPGGTSATSAADQYTFGTPLATVSPASLAFGDQPVGSPSAVLAVTLTNTGGVPVTVGADTLGGADAADFTKSSDGCSRHAVATGGSCSINLIFTPSSAGARHATLAIDDNASDGPHNVVIAGNGTTVIAGSGTAPKPLNAFTLSGPTFNTKTGTATITAVIPETGHLVLAGKGIKRLIKDAAPGKVKLLVTAAAKAARRLARNGAATVTVTVTYTPTGGDPNSQSKQLRLRRKRPMTGVRPVTRHLVTADWQAPCLVLPLRVVFLVARCLPPKI